MRKTLVTGITLMAAYDMNYWLFQLRALEKICGHLI